MWPNVDNFGIGMYRRQPVNFEIPNTKGCWLHDISQLLSDLSHSQQFIINVLLFSWSCCYLVTHLS